MNLPRKINIPPKVISNIVVFNSIFIDLFLDQVVVVAAAAAIAVIAVAAITADLFFQPFSHTTSVLEMR